MYNSNMFVNGVKWVKNLIGSNLNLGYEMALVMNNALNKKADMFR